MNLNRSRIPIATKKTFKVLCVVLSEEQILKVFTIHGPGIHVSHVT